MTLQRPRAAVRVLLVEDSPEVRERLRRLLDTSGGFEIVAEAADADRALDRLHVDRPDAVLLNMDLADGAGFGLLRAIKYVRPDCVVVVVTGFDIPEFRTACHRLGADFFLNLEREFELVPAVLDRRFKPKGDREDRFRAERNRDATTSFSPSDTPPHHD